MAEQSEQAAAAPENVQQGGVVGYQESADHVPDPTAMSGTLETSGTGGGSNERVAGMTRIFGDVERAITRVETAVQERVGEMVEEVRSILHEEEAPAAPAAPVVPQDPQVAETSETEPQRDGVGTPAPQPEVHPADTAQAEGEAALQEGEPQAEGEQAEEVPPAKKTAAKK